MRRILVLAPLMGLVFTACRGDLPMAPDGMTHVPGVAFSHAPDGDFEWVPMGLGALGGTRSEAHDINDDGWVVGEAATENAFPRAFLWSEGTGMTDLGTLGGSRATAFGINAAGTVVGWARDEDDNTLAFRRPMGGPMEPLPVLAGMDHCEAWSINDNDPDRIAGVCYDDGQNTLHAVIWDNDGETVIALGELSEDLPFGWAQGVNAGGAVVGQAFNGTTRAFHWLDGTMTELQAETGEFARADAINTAGVITGTSRFGGVTRATLWPDVESAPQNLGVLPGTGPSSATDINDAANVVGRSGTRSFFWGDGVMVELPRLPDDNVSRPNAINSAGDAVIGGSGGNFMTLQAVIWRLTEVLLDCTYDGLRTRVAELEADGTLSSRQARTLTRLLDQAERFENGGERHFGRAIARLHAFIDEITALQGDGVLTALVAGRLIHCAEELIEALQGA